MNIFYFFCVLCWLFNTQVNSIKAPGDAINIAFNYVRGNLTEIRKFMNETLNFLKLIHGECLPCKKSDLGCDCTNFKARANCLEFYKAGFKVDGIYKIKSYNTFSSTNVYCDQTSLGGGWTVVQRRKDGSVDFKRNWNEYRMGFGELIGEFWFGNEMIHHLTSPGGSELLIDLKMNGASTPVYALYKTFTVASEEQKYELKISGFSGTVNYDGMTDHNGKYFSTFDQCAGDSSSGGWWFSNCYRANLNGKYGFTLDNKEIFWYWQSEQPTLVEMKIRKTRKH